MTDAPARLHDLDAMPWERVSADLRRRLVTGERAMLAQLRLRRGCSVPMHAHDNEQLSLVLEGRLRFLVGQEEEEIIVTAGQVLHLPSGLPHSAEAQEDTLAIDLFSPPRQDWLAGTDDYLRNSG